MNAAFQPGMEAVDSAGGRAGTVEDVLYDRDGAPRYLVIRDRGVFGTDAVVPVAAAAVAGSGIQLTLTRAQVHAAPRFDPQQHGASAGYTSAAAQQYTRSDDQ